MWNICEIRPDAVIGFVPLNKVMDLAQALRTVCVLKKASVGRWRSLDED